MATKTDEKAAIKHCISPNSLRGLKGDDRLAELMARGLGPTAIADICGYSSRYSANAAIQRLRQKMGWQAS